MNTFSLEQENYINGVEMKFDFKLSKINEIESEVKDLHPLLHAIFERMDGISNVAYKQGTQEFGTDFVLTRIDNILKTPTYVGVIVKVNTIKQSSKDVETQIDECLTMPRSIGGSKIYVKEIWVVTTKNFTVNAQDYYTEKYKTAKIEYVDGNRISVWIDNFFPDYWKEVPGTVSQYFSRVIARMEASTPSKTLIGGSLSSDQVIEQELLRIENNEYKQGRNTKKKRKVVPINKVIEKGGVSIIEGEMGAGKSFLLKRACISLCDVDAYVESKRVPIYVSMQDLEEKYHGRLDYTIEGETGESENKEHNYIVMIDSFDEMKMSLEERVDVIKRIIKQGIGGEKSSIIIASRFLEEKIFTDRGFSNVTRYRIAPIPIKKLISLIESVCSRVQVKNRLVKDIGSSNLFQSIPRTPIAALLLTKLIEENSTELPSNLTELYAKYMELSLGRWDNEKGLKSSKEYEATRKVVINLASYFMTNNLSCISIKESKSFFEDYLKKRNLGLDPEDLFSAAIDRSGVLVVSEDGHRCEFRHRSFAEFLHAEGMASKAREVDEEDFDMYWVTATYFWIGLLKDCSEQIQQLSECKVTTDHGKILKIINMGNMLLAAHQTPYFDISRAVKRAFIEAAIYFDDIRSGRTKSKLSQLSEMALLSLFRHIMSEGFGYEFFKDAIESAAIEIMDDVIIDDAVKAYAVFMLGTSMLSFDGSSQLNKLVESLGVNRIPYSVQLGMRHEADLNNISGEGFKRVFKNINRIIKRREVMSEMKLLYNRPINQLATR